MMRQPIKARWNRLVSDIRSSIGGTLISLGATITSDTIVSHKGKHNWKWVSLTKQATFIREAKSHLQELAADSETGEKIG